MRRTLFELAVVALVIVTLLLALPGLGTLRTRLVHISPGWVAAGGALEILSVLSYVVIFRAVLCPRMRWPLSLQIGMSELAANSVLPASGTGGLALGAWALRRSGMGTEQIGRRTVALYFLTSVANVTTMIAFAALYALGALGHNPNPALIYGFGAAALASIAAVLALPATLGRLLSRASVRTRSKRLAAGLRLARDALAYGVPDAVLLLRRRSPGVLIGSFGTTVFDLAVLGVGFRAIGASPPLGVLVMGYLIGQLGGNVPLPGGLGGIDGGLIGALALLHQPLAATTLAVLIYHAISLWVPALLGSIAFLRLRATLRRDEQPAAICLPLSAPIEAGRAPAA